MRDLSHTLHTDMPVYPGDPDVLIEPALTLDVDGVAVTQLHIGSHSGTHIDAPSHTVTGGRTIDRVSLDELVGEALVIHVDQSLLAPSKALGPADLGLDRFGRPERDTPVIPRIVAIATGWDQYFDRPEYPDHPYLTREAAEQLWALGMRVLAVDTLSPDATPSDDFPVHEVVLGQDGLIVENLTGLTSLGSSARLGFFPLKLGAVDGAPIRAVSLES